MGNSITCKKTHVAAGPFRHEATCSPGCKTRWRNSVQVTHGSLRDGQRAVIPVEAPKVQVSVLTLVRHSAASTCKATRKLVACCSGSPVLAFQGPGNAKLHASH